MNRRFYRPLHGISFLFALLGLMATACPGDLGRLHGNRLTIEAGIHKLPDGRSIELSKPVDLTFDAPGSTAIDDEPHTLTTDKPNQWMGGTHLKGLIAGGTPLPGCLVPGSVVVRLPDGAVATRDKDYFLDEQWAGFARMEGGRITDGMPVKISYRAGMMRLDTIEVDPQGRILLLKGEAAMTAPLPPQRTAGSTAWANVFMPYNATAVEPWQIFEITGDFPEPDAAEIAKRAKHVPKTLAKLRAGEAVTIVTWGDSVTCGGDVSSPDKMFTRLFVSRLGERFPKSKINYINAGVGGSHVISRSGQLQKDVLDHKPDLVTIEFVNDCGLSEEAVRGAYKKVFEQIRAAGAEIIFITPHFTMPQWMKHPHPRGKETRPTVALMREITREQNVALADTSKRWEHLEQEGMPYPTLLTNGINHPDDRGHELFVKDLLTFFPEHE